MLATDLTVHSLKRLAPLQVCTGQEVQSHNTARWIRNTSQGADGSSQSCFTAGRQKSQQKQGESPRIRGGETLEITKLVPDLRVDASR
jgi:hypothetical protein